MKKAKLRYFGQLGCRILFVLLVTPVLVYIITDQLNTENYDKFYLIYASPLLLVTIIALSYDLIKKLREVEIRNEALIFENKITGKIEKFLLSNIKGFKFKSFKYAKKKLKVYKVIKQWLVNQVLNQIHPMSHY